MMTNENINRTSEQFASKAEQMIRRGNNFKAARPYAKAAELEEKDRKGGDPVEWDEPLRVREFPR